MNNPIYNTLNGGSSVNPMNGLGNITNFMNNLSNFQKSLGANPGQQAEQSVRQMLANGQISQEQFNQASQVATMLQKITGI